MKYITILNITAKLIFTILIFVFIRSASDYIYVPLINSLGFIIAGILALWIIFRNFNINFKLPYLQQIMHDLKEGWDIFMSQIFIAGYTNSRIFAVGLFGNSLVTGYYAIAEKLMNLVQTFPLASLLQVLYPRLNKIYFEDRKRAFLLTEKFQKYTTFAYLFTLPILYILAPFVLRLITGKVYYESLVAFKILLIAVFFINANTFRVHFLLISGNSKIFLKIHILMGIFGTILTFLMTYLFSFIGTAFSIVIVASGVLILTRSYYNEYTKCQSHIICFV